MDNRYNTELVERFRKGEIILEAPIWLGNAFYKKHLIAISDQNVEGGWTYYWIDSGFLHFGDHNPFNKEAVKLTDFINEVDVVVDTEEGLEKIVDDNFKDTISMIESFNYEVRKLADGEIRRGTKVWCRDAEENTWYEKIYLFSQNELPLPHCVLSGDLIQWYRFATTSDPYAVPKLTRKEICDKFGIDNFEIVED